MGFEGLPIALWSYLLPTEIFEYANADVLRSHPSKSMLASSFNRLQSAQPSLLSRFREVSPCHGATNTILFKPTQAPPAALMAAWFIIFTF